MRTNIENALYAIKDYLQDLVANFLDVNREHINILSVDTNIIGEDIYDWSQDEDDALEEEDSETYYSFTYEYRKDKRTLDYDEPKEMVWQHTESPNYKNGYIDRVMTPEDFNQLFQDRINDKCSLYWFEEKNISSYSIDIQIDRKKSLPS